MGKSKKKDKKKRKRQRSSSSDSGSESDDYNGKHSSKNTKQLQSISDNYGKKSKYDIDGDMPDTEEYVYDQFGQPVVQKSHRPDSPIEEFGGYSNRNSQYSDSYSKHASGSKNRQDHTSMKSQVSSESNRPKTVIDLVDDGDNFTKQKETIYIEDNAGPPGVDDYEQSNCDDYYKDQKNYAECYDSNGKREDTLDCNSAEFMVRKIREEAQSTASNYKNYSKSNNNGTYDDRSSKKPSSDMYEEGELMDHPNSRDTESKYKKRADELGPPGDDDFSDDRVVKKPSKYDNNDRRGEENHRRDRDSRRDISPKRQTKDEPDATPADSSKQDSLSIEETNKLRAKLGLKPLNVDSGSSGKAEEKSYADRADTHRPATNLAAKKNEEKMREKMEAIREKRKVNKKLKKVKGLGEEDDPVLDSAAAGLQVQE